MLQLWEAYRMAVNCRHRLSPKLDPDYFGNAIQTVSTFTTAREVLSYDLQWTADQLHRSVAAHQDEKVQSVVADWEANLRCFPIGNFDEASVTMGSPPRFPMFDNDVGWGKPVAVRSGRSNKFEGKISAFLGIGGNETIDLEVVLAPETMAGIESDEEGAEDEEENERVFGVVPPSPSPPENVYRTQLSENSTTTKPVG